MSDESCFLDTCDTGFTPAPQPLLFGYKNLRQRAKLTYLAMQCFDYSIKQVDENGDKIGYRRKGYITLSKYNLALALEIRKADLNKDLADLEAVGLIRQVRRLNDIGQDTSTRIEFNYNPFIEESEAINERLSAQGIKHKVGNFSDNEPRDSQNESPQGAQKDNFGDAGNKSPWDAQKASPKYTNTNNTNLNNDRSREEINQEDTRDNLKTFLTEPTKLVSEDPPKKEKKEVPSTYTKKIEQEKWAEITKVDLLAYFKDLHLSTYKRHYSASSSEISKNYALLESFIDKYGNQRATEILPLVFKYYDEAGFNRPGYERVGIKSITQDWIVNKILDIAYNKVEGKKIEAQRIASEEYTEPIGPYTPVVIKDMEREDRRQITINKVPSTVYYLLSKGYMPPGWVTLLVTDKELAKAQFLEAQAERERRNRKDEGL